MKKDNELIFDGSDELVGLATVKTQHEYRQANEIGENLLSPGTDPHNKWLGNCNESWIEIAFPVGVKFIIESIGFKSANDFPERDPKSIQVSFDQGESDQEFLPDWQGKRWDTIKYESNSPNTCTRIKFIL